MQYWEEGYRCCLGDVAPCSSETSWDAPCANFSRFFVDQKDPLKPPGTTWFLWVLLSLLLNSKELAQGRFWVALVAL